MKVVISKLKEVVIASFLNESQAFIKYLMFASVAKKEGLGIIAQDLEKIAQQEKEHAEAFYKFLDDIENININKSFSLKKIGDTLKNLRVAFDDETEESTNWYPNCAKIANEGKNTELTTLFVNLANAEDYHASVVQKYLIKMENDALFHAINKTIIWRCEKCGTTNLGESAPICCPVCSHSTGWFSNNSKE